MRGFCWPCGRDWQEINWIETRGRFECATCFSRIEGGKSEGGSQAALSNPTPSAGEGVPVEVVAPGEPGSAWAEVNDVCTRLSAVLDVNDPSPELLVYQRDLARWRALDKRRL